MLARETKAAASIGMPMIVVGELYHGIFNGTRRDTELPKLQQFLATPRLIILDITSETARLYGEISTELCRFGRPVQQNDIWIAALCKQYGYALATADRGFGAIIGLELLHF